MIRWSTPARSARERAARAEFARWMETYWCAQEAWRSELEHETRMFRAEVAEFRERHPRLTLREYMVATAGPGRYSGAVL